MNKSLEYGKEIIEMLKSENIEIDIKVANTINLIAFEAFEKGKKQGVKEGIQIGVNKACKEIEIKLESMKSE